MLMKYLDFKILSKQEMIRIKGGDSGDLIDPGGDVICRECSGDSDCDYKPNLYCASSNACTKYLKVCRRTVLV